MLPYPAQYSVLILDNASIHKSQYLRSICEEKGIRLEFLPPYSPDYNPIELAFSKIKSHVRRHGGVAHADLTMDDTNVLIYLYQAAFSVSPEDAAGWFHHCGYL